MLPPHPGRTWTGAAHRPIDIVSVFKDPTHDELVGGKGFEPNRSPLHVLTNPEGRPSPQPDAVLLPRSGQKQKGLLGDRPRRPGSLYECRPFRALRPPCRYRARRGAGCPGIASWVSTRGRRLVARWPNRMAAPSMGTANWRIGSSTQPRITMYEPRLDLSMTKLNGGRGRGQGARRRAAARA